MVVNIHNPSTSGVGVWDQMGYKASSRQAWAPQWDIMSKQMNKQKQVKKLLN
jgi:hypothetical protein